MKTIFGNCQHGLSLDISSEDCCLVCISPYGEKMKDKFFLTFGQKYRHEHHPSGKKINPDGWIEILAYNYDLARQKAFEHFGSDWCWLYTEQEFRPNDFPAGRMAKIE